MNLKRQRIDMILIAGVIVLCLLVALPVLTYPMGRDQGMYANIARSILDGGLPFIDMWDIKPPAIYYIYAAGIAVFGTVTTAGSAAIRAIDFVFVPLTMIGVYWLGLRLTGRRTAAALAALMFAVFYFTETFASLTQSDSLVTLPMTLAVICVLKVSDFERGSRPALVWAFFAGALCAVTIWFKHYYAIFVLAMVLEHVLARRTLPLKEALAFALGGLPVGLLPLLYFMSNGVFTEMMIVAQGTSRYNAQSAQSFEAFVSQLSNYLRYRWWHWGVLLVLSVVWVLPSPLLNKISFPSPTRGEGMFKTSYFRRFRRWRVIFLWLMAGLAFVLVQAKGFDTHWIPMLPALCLMAAAGTSALITTLSTSFVGAQLNNSHDSAQSHSEGSYPTGSHPTEPYPDNEGVSLDVGPQLAASHHASAKTSESARVAYMLLLHRVLIAVFVIFLLGILAKDTWGRAWPYLTGTETQQQYYRNFQGNDFKPWQSVRIVNYLEKRTQPGDTLYVFGFRPEIAYLTGLRPATRFQAHFPLVSDDWYPVAWQQENVDTLWATMPPYVLVMQADYLPWVTGKHEDSATLLTQYKPLEDWLVFNYNRVETIGDFIIWERKDTGT